MEKEKKAALTPRPGWRSWDIMEGEDVVMMPRALALDLVKLVGITSYAPAAGESGWDHKEHEERFEAHQDRMERIGSTIAFHLADEGLSPTADLVLRSLVIAYEAAPDISKAGELVAALPMPA